MKRKTEKENIWFVKWAKNREGKGEIFGQGRRKRSERKRSKCYGEEKAIVDSCTDGPSKDL